MRYDDNDHHTTGTDTIRTGGRIRGGSSWRGGVAAGRIVGACNNNELDWCISRVAEEEWVQMQFRGYSLCVHIYFGSRDWLPPTLHSSSALAANYYIYNSIYLPHFTSNPVMRCPERWSVAGWCRIRGRLNRQPLIMGVCEVAKLLSLPVPYHYSMVGVIRALWTRDNRLSIECQRQSTLFNLAYPGLHYLALRVVGRKRDKVLRRQFCSNSITFTGTLWLTHDGGLHR